MFKAVKLYENGFMTQPFPMGGEDGEEKFSSIDFNRASTGRQKRPVEAYLSHLPVPKKE
ncbi:MAG: hypothetical protein IJU65_05570 [Desulfovibrio sp.]|nr:hypothetical protein [Desulfovibrio sp.]